MNIKSLLLGSAAALVAVSGARAADAVVIAEPEPAEYVRVCDTYGTGFFYIPGTETCLRISGYARYDIGAGELTRYYNNDNDGDGDNDTYYKRARVQLRVDARSETELGTLRSYLAANFQSTFNNGNDALSQGVALDSAFIELGGFMAGKRDSTYVTFLGYAGNIISDDLGVPYGPFDTNQVSYTYTGSNGLSAVIALETGNASYFNSDGPITAIDDYTPNVVGGLKFAQGWGSIGVIGGYDANMEEGAITARLDVTATEQLSLFLMAGYSTNDGTEGFDGLGNVTANNYYAQWNGDFGVWGGGTFKVNEKLSISAQASYDEDENFAAVLDMPYELVPGFKIIPEVAYVDNFSDDFDGVDDIDGIGGFLRFERVF